VSFHFLKQVVDLFTANGATCVARILYNYKTDKVFLEWALDKLRREVLVHRIIHQSMPSFPVPKFLAQDFNPQNAVGAPFSILEKMEGEGHWSAWPKLSSLEKVNMCSYIVCCTTSYIFSGKPRHVICRSHGADLRCGNAKYWLNHGLRWRRCTCWSFYQNSPENGAIWAFQYDLRVSQR
jgi:hypothetical protein